jgi:DNA modification methylase
VPVIWVDVDDETAVRVLLADNRTNDVASYDNAVLAEILTELANGPGLEGTGYDGDDLDQIIGDLAGDGPKQVVEDEAPEPPADPVTKPGDLWLLGDHRVLCGDSTKPEDVARLMAGRKAGLVFTDPPYGIDFQSNMRAKTPKFERLANDDRIINIAPALREVMADGTAAYVCTRWDVYASWLQMLEGLSVKNLVVWYKRGGGLGDLVNTYSPSHEFIIVAHKGVSPLRGKRHPDVWDIGRDSVNEYRHPTQKPVGVPARAIESHCDAGAVVVDLFLGSGSTLIAAEQLGRKCYGMEISPAYCDVIVQRWENLTGKKAVLADE